MFYKEKILKTSQLRKLAEHKYSVESSSILEPFLQVKIQWHYLIIIMYMTSRLQYDSILALLELARFIGKIAEWKYPFCVNIYIMNLM